MSLKVVVWMVLFIFSSLDASVANLPTHNITIRGEKAITLEQLYAVMDIDKSSMFRMGKAKAPRIKDKLLPTLLDTLRNFYESEGFYDAQFQIDVNEADVSVSILENAPIYVKKISVASDYPIRKMILSKQGKVFQGNAFMETKNQIAQALFAKGYCSYNLDAKAYVDLVKHEAILKFVLMKGSICTFGDPVITGLESIDEDIILSRVRAKKGDRFDPIKVQETYSSIFDLNSFDTVTVSVERKVFNVVPIDINLAEVQKPYHFEGGVGYDTYVGPRVHASIVKKNFNGNAQQTGVKFSWSKKEQFATGEYYKPALFIVKKYGIDFGSKFGYSNLEFKGFQENKGFAKAFLEHNEGRLELRVGGALENIDILAQKNLKDNETLDQAVGEGSFLLLYPYLDITYDARDDKLNPKSGYFLSSSVEFGIDYKPGASSYLKFYLEGRAIHTFDKLTLSVVTQAGVIDETLNTLPESKFFFGGGVYSNRAYGFREIGVIHSSTEESIYGASSMLNLSLEANYPIWKKLYGAVFTDNTMLNENSYDFSGEIISAVGLGVRYLTPIGPFKLDVGFNVNDFSQYGISFQIGQSF